MPVNIEIVREEEQRLAATAAKAAEQRLAVDNAGTSAEVARLRETLDEEELQVLEHINGKLTLKEVSRKAGYGSFAVAKIVARLSHAGIVERRAPPTFV